MATYIQEPADERFSSFGTAAGQGVQAFLEARNKKKQQERIKSVIDKIASSKTREEASSVLSDLPAEVASDSQAFNQIANALEIKFPSQTQAIEAFDLSSGKPTRVAQRPGDILTEDRLNSAGLSLTDPNTIYTTLGPNNEFSDFGKFKSPEEADAAFNQAVAAGKFAPGTKIFSARKSVGEILPLLQQNLALKESNKPSKGSAPTELDKKVDAYLVNRGFDVKDERSRAGATHAVEYLDEATKGLETLFTTTLGEDANKILVSNRGEYNKAQATLDGLLYAGHVASNATSLAYGSSLIDVAYIANKQKNTGLAQQARQEFNLNLGYPMGAYEDTIKKYVKKEKNKYYVVDREGNKIEVPDYEVKNPDSIVNLKVTVNGKPVTIRIAKVRGRIIPFPINEP